MVGRIQHDNSLSPMALYNFTPSLAISASSCCVTRLLCVGMTSCCGESLSGLNPGLEVALPIRTLHSKLYILAYQRAAGCFFFFSRNFGLHSLPPCVFLTLLQIQCLPHLPPPRPPTNNSPPVEHHNHFKLSISPYSMLHRLRLAGHLS